MIKHTKKVMIPEHEEEVDFKTCDICKRSDTRVNLRDDICDLDDVEIEFNDIEMNYPECGKGELYTYDICTDCFKEKVIPALEELGAEPTIKKWDH